MTIIPLSTAIRALGTTEGCQEDNEAICLRQKNAMLTLISATKACGEEGPVTVFIIFWRRKIPGDHLEDNIEAAMILVQTTARCDVTYSKTEQNIMSEA